MLEGPAAGNRGSFGLDDHSLTQPPAAGLEIGPSTIVLRGLVVGRRRVVDVGLVEVKLVLDLPISQQVEPQRAWVQSLVAGALGIYLHGPEEVLDAIPLNLNCDHKSRRRLPVARRSLPAPLGQGRHLAHDDGLAHHASAGHEVGPRLEVGHGEVVRDGIVVQEHHVAMELVGLISISQQVKPQATWVQRFVSAPRHIGVDSLEEIV
mmetsp:Transcript_51539/g.165605  ORF Transcript_51539/g.165605 Transcript_51539/m.165605 type:complete len:207 (-) Transcript_51539:211-831(-)